MTNLGPVADRMIHRLIGCDWGRLVHLPGNSAPCNNQATRRTIIHDPEGGQLMVQLCAGHNRVLDEQTDPHKGETRREADRAS